VFDRPVRRCSRTRRRRRRRSSRCSQLRNGTVLKQDETVPIRLAGATRASLDPAARKLTNIGKEGG